MQMVMHRELGDPQPPGVSVGGGDVTHVLARWDILSR